MAAVGPGGGVISKQPIKTSRRRYFQNGCRVEACGPLRRNHCIETRREPFEVYLVIYSSKMKIWHIHAFLGTLNI